MVLKQISSDGPTSSGSNRLSKRLSAEAIFEKRWLQNPEQFNPQKTAITRDYYNKVKAWFDSSISGKKCVDLGCGYGTLSKFLATLGADVLAVDISENALKKVEGIKTEQQFVPYTSLSDESFDYVIANNLIAEIPENEYRLFISELARLVKSDGEVLISTPLDIYSEDALQKLIYFVETEFNIIEVTLSYHRIYVRMMKLIGTGWLEKQDWLLKLMEPISKFIHDADGVSYAILICKRRSLFEQIPENEQPVEPKGKRAVWE